MTLQMSQLLTGLVKNTKFFFGNGSTSGNNMGYITATIFVVLYVLLDLSRYSLAAINTDHYQYGGKVCAEKGYVPLESGDKPVTYDHLINPNQAIENVEILANPSPSPNCIRGKTWYFDSSSITVKWHCFGWFELCLQNTDPAPTGTAPTPPVTIAGITTGAVATEDDRTTKKSTHGQKTTWTTPRTESCVHGSVWANEGCTGYFACVGGLHYFQDCPWTLKYSAQQEKCVDPNTEPFYCETSVHFFGKVSSTTGQQTTGTTPLPDKKDCDTHKTVSCESNEEDPSTCGDLLDVQDGAITCASLVHTAPHCSCRPEIDWYNDESSITVRNGCSATFDLCIKQCDHVIYFPCFDWRCNAKGKIIRAERNGSDEFCEGKWAFGDNFIEIGDIACIGTYRLCILHEY